MFSSFFRGDFIVPNMDEAFPKKEEEKEDEKDSSVISLNVSYLLSGLSTTFNHNVSLIYKSKMSLFDIGKATILGTSH